MNAEEAEQVMQKEKGIVFIVSGKTVRRIRPSLKVTTDNMSIVDSQFYLVTLEGVWKIE